MLEHKLRLGACVLLSTADALSFSRLKTLLAATDGNLGAQLRKLEDADYIQARKEFQDRKPITSYSLSPKGKRALRSHLDGLQRLIDGTALGSRRGARQGLL